MPERLRAAALAAAGGSEVMVCEGVGGFLVPLTGDYLVRDFARELALPVVIVASPGLGTINHSLLTIESVRGAGLEVGAVVLNPWPAGPLADARCRTARRSRGSARFPFARSRALDLSDPGSWPAL